MINYKHMAAVWHIKKLKVSHIHIFVMTNFSEYLYRIMGDSLITVEGVLIFLNGYLLHKSRKSKGVHDYKIYLGI